MFNKLLIAIDDSDLSRKALATGLDMAVKHGAQVIVLTVTEPVATGIGSGGFGTIDPASILAGIEKAYAEHAKQILAEANLMARDRGLDILTLHVPRRRPAVGIIDTAQSHDCDCIVMGSHGRRGVGRLLLGSQATEVLSRATIPVLIVK